MALSYLLLETGDALLLEDGGYLLTEDSGPEERTAALDIVLDPVAMGAAGSLGISGAASLTLPDTILSATGVAPGGGSVILTLAPVTIAADGALGIGGGVDAVLLPVVMDAEGSLAPAEGSGNVALTLPPVEFSASGGVALGGEVDVELPAVIFAASGGISAMASGSVDITLPAIIFAATGGLSDPASDGEPVSLIEARSQCHIDGEEHDATLDHLRKSARSFVEAYTGLSLRTRTIPLRFAGWPDIARLPVAPVSGVAIQYVDGAGATATLPSGDYALFVDGYESGIDMLAPAPALGVGRAPITVQVSAGFTPSTIPLHVKQAILLLIGQWFDNPSAIVNGPAAGEPPHTVAALLCNDRLFA